MVTYNLAGSVEMAFRLTEQQAVLVARMFNIPTHLIYPSLRAQRAWRLAGQRRR